MRHLVVVSWTRQSLPPVAEYSSTQILCWCAPPRFPGSSLLLGIDRKRPGLALRRNDGTTEIARQWRPEPRHLAGNAGIVARQSGQAIGNVVMIGAVELFGCRTTRDGCFCSAHSTAPETRSERECVPPAKHFAGQRVITGGVPDAGAVNCAISVSTSSAR